MCTKRGSSLVSKSVLLSVCGCCSPLDVRLWLVVERDGAEAVGDGEAGAEEDAGGGKADRGGKRHGCCSIGEGRRPLYWLFSGTYCVFSVVDESEGNIMFLMQRNTFDHHHLNVVPLHV